MTINSLVLFVVVLYLLFVVGRSVWINYNSRGDIEAKRVEISKLREEIEYLEFQIIYFQTSSFKEKEARAKLGYKSPGENVLSLNTDSPQDKIADSALGGSEIKTSNQSLWWDYFFGGK